MFPGYINELTTVLEDHFPFGDYVKLKTTLLAARARDSAIYVFGNGGSAATASHLVCDLNKGCATPNLRFRAICLNESVPLLTAYSNDSSFLCIFEEQLQNFLKPHDVVIAISTSGASLNILRAMRYANFFHNTVRVGITGAGGGGLKSLCNFTINVESTNRKIIEDVHSIICHMVSEDIRLMD